VATTEAKATVAFMGIAAAAMLVFTKRIPKASILTTKAETTEAAATAAASETVVTATTAVVV
jgi:hypothetical protein